MSEAQAIQGCKNKDPKAQKYLFDLYAERMLLVCLRYLKKQEDAEEMMLNGFYKFFDKIDGFVYNGEGSIGAWMRKIMVNECLMLLRKQGEIRIVEEEHAVSSETADDVIANLNAKEIFELIRKMPTGYRTVFNLFVIEGLGHKEIAEALGISEGTSKSQLNKARIQLQKMIIKKGIYEP